MKQREIAETFADVPKEVGTVLLPKWGSIGKWFGLQSRVALHISELPIGKVQLIAAELDDMLGVDGIVDMSQSDQINKLLRENIPRVVRIVALASCKGSKMPSPALLLAINDQLPMSTLQEAFIEVYRRLDLTPFFNIMGLAKSLSLSLIPEAEADGRK